MYYYPIFLNLQERRVLVIGSGRLAEEKVGRLLATGARVRVIAPTVSAGLEELVAAGEIEYVAREYEEGDLDGAFLIISTVNERATNERIFEEANARNVALNVVDDVEHCSFIAPSILRRGDLTIAVSTSGKAPAVAVRLRQQLEEQIGEEYARFLEIVGTLRAPLAARYPDFETRKWLWYELVDSDVLELLRAGDEAGARQRIAEIMGI